MNWMILLTIVVIAYFIYVALQKRNDIERQKLMLKQKQLEQKERELELNSKYKGQRIKEEWDLEIANQEKRVENVVSELNKVQESGDKELIKKAKSFLAYSRDWLKRAKSARKNAIINSG